MTVILPGLAWANDYGKPPQALFEKFAAFTSLKDVPAEIAALPMDAQVPALPALMPVGAPVFAPTVDLAHAREMLTGGQMSFKSMDALFIYGQSM